MKVTIDRISRQHVDSWTELWRGYLAFYEQPFRATAAQSLFERLCRGAPHFGFVGVVDGNVCGLIHALPHASTWSEAGYVYLEDLFVAEEIRGRGVARALIQAVYDEADQCGATRVYWHTEETNERARRLYDTLARVSNFVQYRRA
ncbi:MAG: GNAT family N-acetyltransferase [Pseudomonadota bacterium]